MKKLKINNTARRKMRAEMVSNGTWMGRNAVHRSSVDYNRQKVRLETRRLAREI